MDSALQRMVSNDPYRSYQKTILGKVYVQYLDPTNKEPAGLILEGDPKKGEGVIHLWDELEDIYFRRANKRLFDTGLVVPYTKPVEFEKSPNEKTDEEIEKLFSEKFLAFQTEVQKIDSPITLQRMIVIGESLKKEKYTEYIKQRLAEVQQKEFAPSDESVEIHL